MKIFVVNLCKKRFSTTVVSVLLVLVVLLSVSIGVVTKSFGMDLTVTDADAIPYEKIVILDAGHGGEDPGAVGINGVYEKDLNLEVALAIGEALEERGYVVVYTRTDDRLLYKDEENIKGIRKISDLRNRCNVANRYPDSIFLSIHMNSFGESKYSGLQVYYSSDNDESKLLADEIQHKVKTDLQPDNKRKTKSGKNIYLLDNISNPAVLIECGFLTNKDECEKLSEKEYQKELSFSIVCAIIEYMENKNQ